MSTWLTTALVNSVQLPEASEASIVILRQDRRAPDRHRVPELRFHACSELNFSAAHFHWREKLPVGQHLISLRCSADTYVPLHDVVIRCKIGIANRPVIAIPVAARRLKIVIAQSVAMTAPNQRSPTEDAQPLPCTWFAGRRAVRILEVIHKPFVVVFHARVTLLLHRPRAHHLGRVI